MKRVNQYTLEVEMGDVPSDYINEYIDLLGDVLEKAIRDTVITDANLVNVHLAMHGYNDRGVVVVIIQEALLFTMGGLLKSLFYMPTKGLKPLLGLGLKTVTSIANVTADKHFEQDLYKTKEYV